MQLASGSEFGKYRIISELGRGGMGVVYLAEDQSLGRRIALKVLDRTLTLEMDFEHRFRQEAKIVAALNHPNIMSIHALEKAGDTLAIDMPYIEGGSLAKAMLRERITVPMALHCTRDILLALACCHEEDIVHCDVKPDNILLGRDGKALLSDFGLARLKAEFQQMAISRSSSSGIFLGTPRYAPPESWDGQPPTPAWDVYSLGMVLFEALTGRVAYEADTPLALMKQMLQQPLPDIRESVPGISEALSDTLEGMLAKAPENRFATAGEVLERFKDIPELDHEAGLSLEVAVRRTPKKASRPRPAMPVSLRRRLAWGVSSGMAIAAVAMSALGGWFYFGLDSRSRGNVEPATAVDTPPAASSTVPYRVFDTYAPEDQTTWVHHWLMMRGERSGEWDILAAHDTHVWFLHALSAGADTLEITGHWARYSDPTARAFEYGTVQGSARWLDPDREMAVKLVFRNDLNATEQACNYLARVAQTAVSDAAVMRQMETNNYFQPILYSELVPRHQPWVDSVEGLFLSRTEPVVKIPQCKASAAKPQIDGELTAQEWPPLPVEHLEEAGALNANNGGTADRLRLLYDTDHLYLALEIGDRVADPVITLALIDQFSVPAQRAPQWSARFQGGKLLDHKRTVLDRDSTWNCEWQSAFRQVQGGWNVEIDIPFLNVLHKAQPQAGTRWRLLCSVEAGGSSSNPASIQWGNQDATPVSGSIIAVFGG